MANQLIRQIFDNLEGRFMEHRYVYPDDFANGPHRLLLHFSAVFRPQSRNHILRTADRPRSP